MAVISVRINQEEARMLQYLTDYFHEDRSALFKKSLYEMYEDIQDIKFIDKYIDGSKKKKRKFVSADDLFGK